MFTVVIFKCEMHISNLYLLSNDKLIIGMIVKNNIKFYYILNLYGSVDEYVCTFKLSNPKLVCNQIK